MRTAKPLHKLTRSSPIDVMEWPHLGGGARERSARGKRNQFRDMNSCCSMVEAAAWVASAIAAKITMRGMRLRLQEGRRDNLMESLELSIRNARIIKTSVPRFLTLPARCRQQQQVEQGISGVCSLLKLHRRLATAHHRRLRGGLMRDVWRTAPAAQSPPQRWMHSSVSALFLRLLPVGTLFFPGA